MWGRSPEWPFAVQTGSILNHATHQMTLAHQAAFHQRSPLFEPGVYHTVIPLIRTLY